MRKNAGKITGIVLLGLTGLILTILIGLQVFLNTQKMKEMIVSIASEYVDGDINLKDFRISLFKNFPYMNLSMEDFSLTYPHDKFKRYDRKGPRNALRESGRGNEVDTLASFNHLSLSVNYIEAIRGRYILREASLDRARIHLHCYDSLRSNLDILPLSGSETEEDSTSTLPPIVVKKIALKGRPEIVLTMPKDSLFASFSLSEAVFDGKFCTEMEKESVLNFHLKDLMAHARLAEDQTQFSISKMDLDQKEDRYRIETEGNLYARLKKMGEIEVPISLNMDFSFPEKNLTAIAFQNMEMGIAPISLVGEGEVSMHEDSTYIRAELQISDCKVDEIVTWLGESILPDLLKMKTDAQISLTALCDGSYIPTKKILPPLLFEFTVPRSNIEYEGLDKKGVLQTTIEAETDDYGNLSVAIENLKADLAGIYLGGSASVEDVLSKDPLISIDAQCRTSLDTLLSFIPDSLGIQARGNLDAAVDGMLFLSDMDFYNFAGADISGHIKCDSVHFNYAPMQLQGYLQNTRLSLKPTDEKLDQKITLGNEIQALYAEIDSIYAQYGENQIIRGKDLSVIAQNAASIHSDEFGKEYHPIIAQASASSLVAVTSDNAIAALINSKNTLKLSSRKNGEKTAPILSANSQNEKIVLRQGQGRIGLSHLDFNATAVMENVQTPIQEAETDSTHIDISRQEPVELDKLLAEYMQNWKISGSLHLKNGFVLTPYFPLLNHIEKLSGHFNNDEIRLDNLTIHSGKSDLNAQGNISGIKQAIADNGTIFMNLGVNSNLIDMNELLSAMEAGSDFSANVAKKQEAVSNDDIQMVIDDSLSEKKTLDQIAADTADTSTSGNFAIMVPANINAQINLSANEIKYSDLETNWASSDIALRNKCLQITNTVATSNMGDIYFEGFYSSENKDNLKAGFELNMASITADKVITLFPAVDSLMPMLKSFKGILDCELAAVSDLDTSMNLKTNSINGVMRIKGKDLSLDNIGPLKKLAKILMFKNKKTGIIDDMSVEGLIKNDELQIFPFVMKIDRYQFAASGIQQFDQNFKYHISVLKSPLPFRFGINLKGNFDDWKFKIGKAKYKNVKVPVFTKELNTIQINLVNSIHDIFNRGVDLAIKQTQEASQNMENVKKGIGLNLEEETDDLTIEEQIEMEGAIIEQELQEDVEKITSEVEKTAEKSHEASKEEKK